MATPARENLPHAHRRERCVSVPPQFITIKLCALFTLFTLFTLFVGGCGGGVRRYNPTLLERASRSGSAEVPQVCGTGARYGGVAPGAVVVLRRHRAVDTDRNWVASMRSYVGRATRVTGRSGRDPQGCLVVQVAIDNGRHQWRVRDLSLVGHGLGPGGGDAIPQRCGQDDEMADFGLIQPGARVILHRHRHVNGETNWTEEMGDIVEQEAEVTDVSGVDAEGCPVFHVDLDRGEWAWRVRDTTLVQAAMPQVCDRSQSDLGHGSLEVGARVRLGHHRAIRGERNWSASMEQYVDRVAQVTSLGPLDDQGCPVAHVDLDQGTRPWRVRDLVILERSSSGPRVSGSGSGSGSGSESGSGSGSGDIPQECADGDVEYGPIRVGTRIVLGRHRPVNGDANWDDDMEPFVGRTTRVQRLSGADAAGCPGIRIEADSGEWFWRIRDVRLAE